MSGCHIVTAQEYRAAMALIYDPFHWVQGRFASTKEGNWCLSSDKWAFCFCAYGALNRVVFAASGSYKAPELERAAEQLFGNSPQSVNDELGHTETLRMFERAIELAELRE